MKRWIPWLSITYFVSAAALLGLLQGHGPWASAALLPGLEKPAPPSIRVRLLSGLKELDVQGLHVQFHKELKKSGLLVSSAQTTRVARANVGAKSVWILQQPEKMNLISSTALFISGDRMRIAGLEAPGKLMVTSKKNPEQLDVIAILDLEDYLEDVLPWEMSPAWPLEALKAQAIAARTYAIFRKQDRRDDAFDVESTVDDQVYKKSHTVLPKAYREKIHRAIRETAGMILVKKNGEPYPAYFHADCGGMSEAEGRPVSDAHCPLAPHATWKSHLSAAEVFKKLGRVMGEDLAQHTLRDLINIEISDQSISGRARKISVQWSDGTASSLSGEDFRRAIGMYRVRSTKFDLHFSKAGLLVIGTGYGHGIGLCQWGSRAWAEDGWTFQKILSHYYPMARMKVLGAQQ